MATHKNVCSFLAVLHEKTESFVIDFSLPRLQITLAPLLIPLGACRKRGQLHLWLQKQVYHCLAALSWLVGPLTRNAPMRQSGAIGAWRLAAGSDNLLGDVEKKSDEGLSTTSRHLCKTSKSTNTEGAMLPQLWAWWLVFKTVLLQE